jgi:hypothetical protein
MRAPHAVLCLALFLAALMPGLASAEDRRSRFFDECLTPGPTRFTPEFDAYSADAYVVNKLELVEALPRAARERGRPLRASLIVGPHGMLWTYSVFTFVQEGQWIRVNALVMPHARITGKSTGLLSPREFADLSAQLRGLSFARSARDTNALRAQIEAQQKAEQASKRPEIEPEWMYELLFAEFEPEAPLVFGSFRGKEHGELADLIEELTAGLKPTYEHGQRVPGAKRRTNWVMGAGPFIGFQHAPLPGLNRKLAQLGYAALDAAEHWLGLGFEASWHRLRLGYELALAPRRLAPHVGGAQTRVSFSRERVVLRVGYDVWVEPEFRVFPLLGLRAGSSRLSGGSEAAPLARAPRVERARPLELDQDVTSIELALGFDGHIPLRRRVDGVWLIVGARVGHVLGSWTGRWEVDDRGGFDGLPAAPESSFFGMFVLGLGVEPP